LIEYQPYINSMRTDAPYTEAPPRLQGLTSIPEREKYLRTFEVSWKQMDYFPLPESLAEAVGLPRDVGRDLSLEIPATVQNPGGIIGRNLDSSYIVLSARSQGKLIFKELFENFIRACKYPVIVVGGKEDKLDSGIDATGIGFLDMARLIANAKSFVGVFSSPLVVAQAFPIPKTCVFDGSTWHPTQIIMNGETEYLVNPTVDQIIESAGRKLRVKRI
jgi:hypothetical protein